MTQQIAMEPTMWRSGGGRSAVSCQRGLGLKNAAGMLTTQTAAGLSNWTEVFSQYPPAQTGIWRADLKNPTSTVHRIPVPGWGLWSLRSADSSHICDSGSRVIAYFHSPGELGTAFTCGSASGAHNIPVPRAPAHESVMAAARLIPVVAGFPWVPLRPCARQIPVSPRRRRHD
jgi:hypothetical protein